MLGLNLRKFLLFIGDIVLFYFSLIIALKIGFWQSFNWGIFLEHLLPFTILFFSG
jgi:hypothetical protein